MKFIFKKITAFIVLMVLFCTISKGQNITKIEYFFNNDPGVNNATAVTGYTAQPNIMDYPFNIDISSLSFGLHSLYVRSQSATGVWSAASKQLLFKQPANTTASNITQMEYFIDSDTGVNKGTPIVGFTASGTVSDYAFTIDISTLSFGVHNLYCRSKNADGNWSVTSKQLLFKQPANTTAANITQMEYFINNDPGVGNGTAITGFTQSNNVSDYAFTIDISALSFGIHSLYCRSKNADGNWSITSKQLLFKQPLNIAASNITQMEYFINNDPGVGNGTAITGFTQSNNVSDYAFTIDISALSFGVHNLYCRSKNADGNWSITSKQLLFKQPLNIAASNITQMEYFINNDPGVGNGTAITGFTQSNDVSDYAFVANVGVLPLGIHTIYVRTKNADGKWSITNKQTFDKQALPPGTPSDIVRLEYYYDNDPGFGNATAIGGFTASSNISDYSFTINITGITNGLHTLYTRSLNANGEWSITNKQLLYKQPVPSVAANVTQMEYFYDNDPGYGNAVQITGFSSSNDIANFSYIADVTAISNGIHSMYVRTKNTNGEWSLTNQHLFLKQPIQPVGNITKLEYFIDSDPGVGNATPITGFTASTDISNFSFVVDLSAVPDGLHNLYVRSKDDWGITNRQLFLKAAIPSAINITQIEYFLDNDPGIGNATQVTGFTAANDVTNYAYNVDVTALADGLHTLYTRTKNAAGKWAITNKHLFLKKPIETLSNITQVEYFIDNDPGVGNATQVTITPATQIQDFTFNGTFNVTNGNHYFYIRSKDANGRWSLTNVAMYNANGVVAVSWLDFTVKKQAKDALVSWTVGFEDNLKKYDIERSSTTNNFKVIDSILVPINSSITKSYNYLDKNTLSGANYYRIKQVENDGSFSYSTIAKVDFNNQKEFEIRNNPSSNPIAINLPATSSIIVFDITGKKLKTIAYSNNNIELGSGLVNGEYIVVLVKNNEVLETRKIIIVK